MEAARTIDDVIRICDEIIANAKASRSRIGLFAAMYRQVTLRVKQAILKSEFEDNRRMEELDVRFANRYFNALFNYQTGKTVTRSWELAFRATQRSDLLVVQHLLLAINAHINLDLAIVTAEIAPGAKIADLANDFQKINLILSELLDPIQEVIAQFSPLLEKIDRVGGNKDELLATFGMEKARSLAWNHAKLLAKSTPKQQKIIINVIDSKTQILGKLISSPNRFLGKIVSLPWVETESVVAVIDALNGIVKEEAFITVKNKVMTRSLLECITV